MKRLIDSRLSSVLIGLVLSACGPQRHVDAGVAGAEIRRTEIIYRLRGSGDLLVFDLAASIFSVEGPDYLSEPRRGRSDIGGRFDTCSNESFYCLGYPLVAVVPRQREGQRQWDHESRHCEASEPLFNDRVSIRCEFENRQMVLLFSPRKGIERFESAGDVYELTSERGFFADGD
jgi:hypothetical protein